MIYYCSFGGYPFTSCLFVAFVHVVTVGLLFVCSHLRYLFVVRLFVVTVVRCCCCLLLRCSLRLRFVCSLFALFVCLLPFVLRLTFVCYVVYCALPLFVGAVVVVVVTRCRCCCWFYVVVVALRLPLFVALFVVTVVRVGVARCAVVALF